MNRGYIKLYRCIEDNTISKDNDYFRVWVHILMRANYKEKTIIFNNTETLVPRGSFVTSRSQIAENSNVQESKVERILKYLKSEHQIEQQTFSKFRIISVVNYEMYQQSEQENEQHVNNTRTTREQHVNTTKKDKKEKKVKKDKKYSAENFIPELKKNPAYSHIDIDTELSKMDAWFLIPKNKNRKKTSQFILNWLNKIEKPHMPEPEKKLPFAEAKKLEQERLDEAMSSE